MKLNIEDYLHKIDSAYKTKSQKDIYMMYVMIFGLIFAFSYLLFWETSESAFTQQREQINALDSKINIDKMYLEYNPEIKITSLEKEISDAENALLTYKDNNEYIKNKIEAISSLIYDERAWGEYLHSISKNAKKFNIKILNFTNTYSMQNKSFGHILDINLSTTGNYSNTLNFINSLEQSELVVDLHDLKIKAEDTLNTDLNISVWGITY
ncbi:type 4a pilus biogenesis protein PilO [bacterium]|nr:type 4a pilus biogenesis protein PilO [bacterium]MBU1994625.1 type 4a pilus biogenesis protein PilO [bacterium]